MRATFFNRANWVGRSARLPLSEVEANERHENRKAYGVLLLEDDSQIEVAFFFGPTFCEVTFIGPDGREDLTYAFEEQGDRLFLFQATYTTYVDDSSQVARREIYLFNTDGVVRIMEGGPGIRQPTTMTKHVDVSRNWTEKPTFGSLRAITKREL